MDHRRATCMMDIVPLTRHLPPKSPPLCSICRHKAPLFGTPPKWFNFMELEDATEGFSKVIAEVVHSRAEFDVSQLTEQNPNASSSGDVSSTSNNSVHSLLEFIGSEHQAGKPKSQNFDSMDISSVSTSLRSTFKVSDCGARIKLKAVLGTSSFMVLLTHADDATAYCS
ncbi:hypothetical protein L1987_27211 [Smallanthus sonchifolius]|uniref:Uncharacterized protein n=1 Tax=Smallanthus sonchifolius TaxID=185202 RepID=A0ACB9IA65_9ASTR|nr:hypothetical protein L1987_27211 [Smallanthus sonchifolius]